VTSETTEHRDHRAGAVALVGRPNVGKSTLLNALVGVKVAIVSPKPQTTRNRICGIRTLGHAQIAFLDTPGIHEARSPLNRRMVDIARRTLAEADAAVAVLDATAALRAGDGALLELVAASGRPAVIALNKIDRVAKPALLPLMAELGARMPGRDLVPISALRRSGLDVLVDAIVRVLPAGPPLYGQDEFTTASLRFLAAELVREQVFLATRDEIPYGTAVVVERFEERPEQELTVIAATILVERPSHKPIVLGAGGARLRDLGARARVGLEDLLGTRVFLELFVRVEPDWARSRRRLEELGL